MNKSGFTLAEVLITLGIIGVVAALTIPGLLANYAKIRTAAQLKESYSILQQAIKLSQDENGNIEGWDTTLTGSEFFHAYLANYLKWGKEYTSTELAKSAPRTHLNGTAYSGTFYTSDISSHFTLLNGTLISCQIEETGMMIGIDVNGLSKPNRMGIDTFYFFFTSEYGLRPLGDKGTTAYMNFGSYERSTLTGSNGYACNKNKKGYWCAALIMYDGWKISNDYPWN